MPIYQWEATTKTGVLRKGEKEAASEAAVTKYLKGQQLQVKKIVKKKGVSELFGSLKSMLSRVKQDQLVIFTRQFATMIDAGLPIVQCLDILWRQQNNKFFQAVIQQIKNDVEAGSTFAESLKRHPSVFDTLFVNLVAAGEVGGILDTIFQRISAHMEKALKLKRMVKAAMVYPMLILGVSVVVIVVMMTFVIPIFEKMFASFAGAKLPAPTQMVIDISHGFKNNFFLIALVAGALFFGLKSAAKTKKGRYTIDATLIKLPLFGDLIKKVAVARFARTLGTMISSGVPILDAMDIVSRASGNMVIEEAIVYAKNAISEGKTMAEPIEERSIFPDMVPQMIRVGESTGALDQMMNKIADFYEEEVDAAMSGLTKIIEPLMMVFLGGIIGGLVLAMYLPIFELAGSLQGGGG